MGKKKFKKLQEELNGCASANDCTGLFQKVSLDTDEVARFHKQFNGDEEN